MDRRRGRVRRTLCSVVRASSVSSGFLPDSPQDRKGDIYPWRGEGSETNRRRTGRWTIYIYLRSLDSREVPLPSRCNRDRPRTGKGGVGGVVLRRRGWKPFGVPMRFGAHTGRMSFNMPPSYDPGIGIPIAQSS